MSRAAAPASLRVALDATPLLGLPTGVGVFCQGALTALAQRPGVDVRAYAVSWRRRRLIEAKLPAGRCGRASDPCRPARFTRSWTRADFPPLEWFIGATDVVHGTNFLVPPTGRAAAVVSVHDLTPLHHPELCDAATLAYPGLIRRALHRGAWVHTDSAFVAREVIEAFDADPSRVRVVNPGIPDLPVPAEAEAAAVLRRFLPPGTARFCLAIGTAEPRKDLPGLVRAFGAVAERQPDVALVLAGPPGWGEQALESAVAASKVGDRIVRTGWLQQLELAALLSRAACWPSPPSTRGSASRRCRPCAPACPWSRPGRARCPRYSATARCWSTWAITRLWPGRSPPA